MQDNISEQELERQLKKHFGYDSFKSDLQKQAILCIVKSNIDVFSTFKLQLNLYNI